jgi:uncharacterized protein (DUF2132 family)
MSEEINYQNNPLHGLTLKAMLTEIVDHYGFEILHAYLYIHSFKTNPSIESSVKFLKKTQWAREKVEAFYLYKFKSLPKVSSDQYELPPRDRIIPEGQSPGQPLELTLEDAERIRDKRETRANEYDRLAGRTGKGAAKPFHATKDKAWNKPASKSPWGASSGAKPSLKPGSTASASTPASESSQDIATHADPWANSRNKFK